MTEPSFLFSACPQAVVFDLFGTLVDAPTVRQRATASLEIGAVIGVPGSTIEQVFIDSWNKRHDGSLPTLTSLSDFLWRSCGNALSAPRRLTALLLEQAAGRLATSADVLLVLETLRRSGTRIGILSDASADIAEAWRCCPLSDVVDAAVFSCRASAVKPHPSLYRTVLEQLGTVPQHTLYCGDGGGDELRGAAEAGLAVVRVRRRGSASAIAFGDKPWVGPSIESVEALSALASTPRTPR